MKHEKVLFVYSTLIREGMVASGYYHPDAVLFEINHKKTYSLAITVGLLYEKDAIYWNEIDVVFENKSVINKEHDGESTFHVLASSSPNANDIVNVASFYLRGVNFPRPGMYTAVVTLYDSDEQGEKRQLVDKKECCFIVAGE
ncbi:hypothetical protein [Enterobacter hormaechei]|uniref:hypothetical protein n=1 Tax=Enterobacter hormaechei TaxID=158836 RepID=UPI003D6FE37D